MSLAEELKTLADESKKAQEADPKFVAKGLLKDVRAMCSTAPCWTL